MKRKQSDWTNDAWELICVLDWKNAKDSEALARRCITLVGVGKWKLLSKFVDQKVNELRAAIKIYEAENGSLDIGSDDGFSDVCYHVVGLGKEEFEKCILNPKLVEERYQAPYGSSEGYRESFAYVFLEPSPERTPDDTKTDLAAMIDQAEAAEVVVMRQVEVLNELQVSLAKLIRVLRVIKKDLSK